MQLSLVGDTIQNELYLSEVLGSDNSLVEISSQTIISDILIIVFTIPLSHIWPCCRQESEDLRTLVSPSSVLLCNSLMQQ